MCATRIWNEGAPGSGDNVGEGDDRIREEKFDTRERLQQGGHVVSSGGPYTPAATTANNDGKHAVANGGDHPTGFKVYKADQSTVQCDFSDTAITAGTGVSFVGGGVSSGAEPGHTHRGTIAIWLPGAISPGRARAVFRAPKSLTFEQAHVHVMTRHTGGGSLRLNIGKLIAPADGVDRIAASPTAIQAAGDRPILAPSGNYHDDGNSVFSVATMAADDELLFDIEDTGAAWSTSPVDVLVHLDVLG
jgi:hypothetical protein